MATSYSEKLKDPRWQKKRLEILNRDDFKCLVCGDGSETLHVHHKRYEKGCEPWDYPNEELCTLCETCHSSVHDQGQPWAFGGTTASLLEAACYDLLPSKDNALHAALIDYSEAQRAYANNLADEQLLSRCEERFQNFIRLFYSTISSHFKGRPINKGDSFWARLCMAFQK
jgi:hypothetical protein